MDYRLKQAYERVYTNEKPLTPRITNLAEAYSYGVVHKDQLLTEVRQLKDSSVSSLRGYFNNINSMLDQQYPPSMEYVEKNVLMDFIPIAKQKIQYDPNGTDEDFKRILNTATLKGTINNNSREIFVRNLVKTPQIKGKSSNLGDVIEGVLGVAVFARLTLNKEEITKEDVFDAITTLEIIEPKESDTEPKKPRASLAATLQASVKGKGEVIDNFSLRVVLKRESMKTLLNKDKLQALLGTRFEAIILYANDTISYYAKYFKNNQKVDNIKVIADGVSQNTETKVDVSMKFVTQDESGNTVDKDVEHFQLSIKTSKADLIGQRAGGGSSASREDQFGILMSFWSQFLPDDHLTHLSEAKFKSAALATPSQIEMYRMVYAEAHKHLSNLIKKGNNESIPQQTFFKILESLKDIATGKRDYVKVAQFEEGNYFILNFNKIYTWIKDNRLQLACDYSISKKGLPIVEVYGSYASKQQPNFSPSEMLFRVRVFSTSAGYIRNWVEKGPLLTKIVTAKEKNVASPQKM